MPHLHGSSITPGGRNCRASFGQTGSLSCLWQHPPSPGAGAIRIRLEIQERLRDLAMLNFAIDSRLRGCDLGALRVDDVLLSGRVRPRMIVIKKKTGRPVQFEITEQTRETVMPWISKGGRRPGECLFPSRIGKSKHLTTRHADYPLGIGPADLPPPVFGYVTGR